MILLTEKAPAVPTRFFGVIKVDLKNITVVDEVVDLTDAIWLQHPRLQDVPQTDPDHKERLAKVIASWQDAFSYTQEKPTQGKNGLRLPQIGAVHAIHAHWATSNEPATIVMPTGTGKTETMLSIMVSAQCGRILVIVPTDALRTQIAEKFLTLGVLKKFDVVSAAALFPVVGTLKHKPKDFKEVDEFFKKCNVIVTTSNIAGQCQEAIQERMASHCGTLFIDEAHHIAAPTWSGLKAKFSSRKIIQFTATPFREDEKPVEGKIVFKYPLRKAQEEDYFRPINFKPILEFQPEMVDRAIAEAALAQLREDHKYKHIIMARVATVERAAQVFSLYEKNKEYNPVQIHSGIKTKKERESIRKKILSGESRIVVCVDMLGEGFDLPELKIAAFHDIKKSLAVTLQLAGRFTRARSDLGSATFIANVAEVQVRQELKKLYRQDTDWNFLLPQLSEEVIDNQISLKEFTDGFTDFPSDIPLRNLRPAMSTVVYKTKCEEWTPENFFVGIPGIASFERLHYDVNPHKNTLIIVTARKVAIDWADIKEIYNWDWELHILFWDNAQNLLFIHASTNKGEFKQLAKAVAGDDAVLINEQAVFRCFAGVNRLRFQNVGLTRQLGRLIRYTGSMGSDVELGLGELLKQNTKKSVLFGTGFEGGKKVTMGASRKGRLWSFATGNLDSLVKWLSVVGNKVSDDTINPDEVLKGTLESEILSERPALMPIGIDWSEDIYKETETAYTFTAKGGITFQLFEADIALTNPSETDELTFEISAGANSFEVRLKLFESEGIKDYLFEVSDSYQAFVKYRSMFVSLAEFLNEAPPVIWFLEGSSLEGNVYTKLKTKFPPYDSSKINVWDWTGINLKVESQGTAKQKDSIQFRVIEKLRREDYDLIFDDDGSGETADVVAIRLNENNPKERFIEVEFYHCKFSLEPPGARVDDLYTLCGQARKKYSLDGKK